jgi:hypothetical protein
MSTPEVKFIQQSPVMPTATITRIAVNSAGNGPYYVYSPGLDIEGLQNMVYLFNNIPGGEIFPIGSGLIHSNKGTLPPGAEFEEVIVKDFFGNEQARLSGRQVPAEVTLNALLSDRSITNEGFTHVPVFNSKEIQLKAFNMLIHPDPVKPQTYPINFNHLDLLKKKGMLAVRKMWLEEALDGLKTGRILEDIRRVADSAPYLYEIWSEAIRDVLIPSNEMFIATANTNLSAKEEDKRSGRMQFYDTYCKNLMWLLGREPQDTALNRTLEFAARGGQGGLSGDDIVKIIEAAKSSTPQQAASIQAAVSEYFQCPRCGNRVEAMATGGPPDICWRCNHSFHRTMPQSAAVAQPQAATYVPPPAPQPLSARDLSDQMWNEAAEEEVDEGEIVEPGNVPSFGGEDGADQTIAVGSVESSDDEPSDQIKGMIDQY